jgi:hypothetical protein
MSGVHSDSATVAYLRRALLAILMLGLAGLEAELLLLKHFEDWKQWTPIVLMGVALIIVIWQALRPSRASLRSLQAAMAGFAASGAAGVFLHYRGNVEWELERTPGIAGAELVRMALMGATPTLAPGAMLQLGLIGLLYAFRHPILGAEPSTSSEKKQ